eukprot:5262259-Pyramimonas_sp.AAC.1
MDFSYKSERSEQIDGGQRGASLSREASKARLDVPETLSILSVLSQRNSLQPIWAASSLVLEGATCLLFKSVCFQEGPQTTFTETVTPRMLRALVRGLHPFSRSPHSSEGHLHVA